MKIYEAFFLRAEYHNCREFETVDELKRCVVAEWESLGSDSFYKHARSMKKLCIEVLRLEEKKTTYQIASQGTVFIKVVVFFVQDCILR